MSDCQTSFGDSRTVLIGTLENTLLGELLVETMSDSASNEGTYDLVDETPAIQKGIVVAARHDEDALVLQYQRPGKTLATPIEPQTIKDSYLPIALLGGGILIEVIVALIWDWRNLLPAMTRLTFELVVGTAVMMVAMLITAKLRAIDLGNLGTAALKLAAIAVAPSAIVKLALPIENYIPLGGIIGWVGEFIIFFALLGALFDLQEEDTWYCMVTMLFTRLAFYLLMKRCWPG